MSNHSVIEHRANYHYIKVEEDLLAICSTGKQSPHCKALILSILEGWMNTKRDKEDGEYVYMTIPELIRYMYMLYGRNFIISSLDELLTEGLIERRPIKRFEQNTYEYRLVVDAINARIRDLPEKSSKDVMPNLSACIASMERNKALRAEGKAAKDALKKEKEQQEQDSRLKINGGSLKINGVEKSTTTPFKNQPNLTSIHLTSQDTSAASTPTSLFPEQTEITHDFTPKENELLSAEPALVQALAIEWKDIFKKKPITITKSVIEHCRTLAAYLPEPGEITACRLWMYQTDKNKYYTTQRGMTLADVVRKFEEYRSLFNIPEVVPVPLKDTSQPSSPRPQKALTREELKRQAV